MRWSVGNCGFIDLSGNLGLDHWSQSGKMDGSLMVWLRWIGVLSPSIVSSTVQGGRKTFIASRLDVREIFG